MRLLEYDGGKISLTDYLTSNILPLYAILSHTWGPDDEEVTYRDMVDGTGEKKTGYEKIRFCAKQAKRDGLRYFWVDTCCIDKSDLVEVQRSINSMFRWYRNASRCYVYLSDTSGTGGERLAWEPAFRAHRWFTRGWTLQELLAPVFVEFFTQDGHRLGDRLSLAQQIHEITGIPTLVLRDNRLDQFDVEERFIWADNRQTKHEEDWAYCLLGIFGVFMVPNYGEGRDYAVRRLRKEIADTMHHDDTIRQEATKYTWMVPFERNPSFTSRESELKTLRKALFTGHHTVKVAITGLGGVGKTQLALELVYRVRAEYKNCAVIWIPATTKESLVQAYVNAAKLLGIPGCEDDKADVKKLVRDYLSSDSAGRWLLVFDNADDVGIWINKSQEEDGRLIDYLPRNSRGAIVFTTRDKKTAVKLAGRNVVEMTEMDDADSKRLVGNYLVDQTLLDNQEEAVALLGRLTYLPLAIVQAAVYINENGIGLQDYLSLLEEQEEDVIDLLSNDFEDDGRYGDIKNPVATTWLISFEQIRRRDPLAADYLSFMACVDAKDIPVSLLLPGQSRNKESQAMGILQSYSFIAKRSSDSDINIHRLVHLAMRNWLRKDGLLLYWTGKVIVRLAELLADAGYHNMATWRSYIPHAYYVLESSSADEDGEDRLDLLRRYGICLYYDGRYQAAEVAFEQVMETRKTKLGADHPSTLTSMANLASTYRKQGRWEEAEKLEVQVMETSVDVSEPGPVGGGREVGRIANLASTYRNQGRWEEAEKLEVQVIETRKIKLRADHPDTLTSMANLVLTYQNQGRWEKAEKLEVQVMETRKIKLGADHPDTLTSIGNLASTFQN